MAKKSRAQSRETRKDRNAFAQVKLSERWYGRQLRKIANHVGDLVDGLYGDNDDAIQAIIRALEAYAEAITPWAKAQAKRMLVEVSRRDKRAWDRFAKTMGVELRREIEETPLGAAFQAMVTEQVALITSLPLEAAQRVQKLSIEALSSGVRSRVLAADILATGEVTRSRATLIARTEVARAASKLTQARAEYIGSPGYIWTAVKDAATRKSHREMDGQYVEWSKPPTLSDGYTTHAGQVFNCRCVAQPVLPQDLR